MLATNHVLHNVLYFNVMPPSELSDHSIIYTRLKCGTFNNSTIFEPNVECKTTPLKGQYIWSNECKLAYQTALVDVESSNTLVELDNSLNDKDSSINDINNKLNNIYLTAASKTLLFKSPIYNHKISKRKPKPWMSNDITLLKREVRKLGRRIQINPKNCNLLHAFANAKREFNRMKKKLKHEFYKTITDNIDNLNQNNSRNFWKVLNKNKIKQNSNSSIPGLQTFVNHYQNLLCSKGNNSCEHAVKSEIQKLTPLDYPNIQ